MSRARANERLYHARILIDAWREMRAGEEVARSVLDRAFGTAVCQHLAAAYGWFLLEIAQPGELPERPPRCCDDLPPVPEGREVSPEIREFKRLESEAWLSRIVAYEYASHPPATGSDRTNLAVAADVPCAPDEVEQWHTRLSQLFDRMSDSLDEY